MSMNHENSFPFRPIIYGSLITLGIVTLFTLVLAIMTELGWMKTVYWSDSLFLVPTYLGVIVGTIMAGLKSRARGWLTGMGTGILSSFWLLLLTIVIGEPVKWGIFLTKTLISSFIGTFGGIIGVNLSGSRT